MSFEEQEYIRTLFEEVYPTNTRNGDLSSYGDMYTKDAIVTTPDVPDRVGVEDIVQGLATSIEKESIDPVFTAEEIEVTGDLGYVAGTCSTTVYPHDGSPSNRVRYRVSWSMKKEAGIWKIDRETWNNEEE
jgi:uncharacterized protein (TIGR02246 family)